MDFAKEFQKLRKLGNYQAGIRLISELVNRAYAPGLMLLERCLESYSEAFGSSERLLRYIEENVRILSVPADYCRHVKVLEMLDDSRRRRNLRQEESLPPGQVYCLLVSERPEAIADDLKAFAQYLYPGWVDKGVIPPIDVERTEKTTESLEVAQHAFTCAAAYLVQKYGIEVPDRPPHWIFTEASGRVSLIPYVDVSHGLAAAVAYVSKVLEIKVPTDKAITGIINHDSFFSVSGVKAIAEKVTAAYYWHCPSINQVIIPKDNLGSIPDFCRRGTDFEVKPVDNLEQCLYAVFGKERLEKAIEAFLSVRERQKRLGEKSREPELVIGLPPAASPIFKDREDKVFELRRLLRDPDVKFICLAGRGGIGKTALLSKICTEIERGELRLSDVATSIGVDGIIYITFRGTGKLTVEQLCYDFGRVLGTPHYEELMDYWGNASHSLTDKARFLLSKLRNGYYLLVLDNFEDALSPDNTIEDTDLQTFVDLCLTTSNALYLFATSRERMVMGGQDMRAVRILPLDSGLPDGDGIALLRDLDPDGELGLRDADEEILQDAVQRCYGLPRALETIAGILSSDPTLTLAQLLENTALFNEQVVENLIAEHYRRLTDDQQRVLEALAVYNRPVPAAAVRYLLEESFPNLSVDSCLRILALNYFVTYQRGHDSYELHPLDREYAYSFITDDGDYTKRLLHRRAAEFCLSMLKGNERQDVEWQLRGWEHLLKAEEREEAAKLANIISRTIREWGRYGQIVELYRATALGSDEFLPEFFARTLDCLCMLGRMKELEEMLEASTISTDPYTRGLALEMAARFYADSGNYKVALSAAREGLDILLGLLREAPSYREKQLRPDVVRAAHTVALCFYLQGIYSKAIKQYQRAERLMKELGDEKKAYYCRYYLADSLRMVASFAEAERVMEIVLQIEKEKIPPAAYMVMGQIQQDQGHFETAWNTLQQAKAVANRRGSPNSLSRIEWAIGRWYLLHRDFNSAIGCYLYASRWFSKWGWMTRLAMIKQDIGVAQHHLGKLREAHRLYEESLALDAPSSNYSCNAKLGILCLEEGKVEEAQNQFARSIKRCRELLLREPHFHNAIYHLALAQLGIGQSENAIATYCKALEVCSAKGVVLNTLQDLQLLTRVPQSIAGLGEAIWTLEAMLHSE